MEYSTRSSTSRAGPVRVCRNGNARTLAVPTEIVNVAHIELGDQYMVELVDGDLVFSRVKAGRQDGHFVGEGPNRVFVAASGTGMPVGADPVQPDPIDWDF